MVAHRWTCPCCGQAFESLPTCWSVGPPVPYLAVPEEDRGDRALLYDDVCRVDDVYFVRGQIEIPIIGSGELFVWSVWTSLSDDSMDRMVDAWEDEDRERIGPFFGWLCSNLPYEPSTVGLKTMVHNRKPGVVPFIEVEPTDHPLAIEQRYGLTMERVERIAADFLAHS